MGCHFIALWSSATGPRPSRPTGSSGHSLGREPSARCSSHDQGCVVGVRSQSLRIQDADSCHRKARVQADSVVFDEVVVSALSDPVVLTSLAPPCSSNFHLMSTPPLSSAFLHQLPPFPPRPCLINKFWMPNSHPAPQTDAVVYWGESGLDTFAALGARVRAPR